MLFFNNMRATLPLMASYKERPVSEKGESGAFLLRFANINLK